MARGNDPGKDFDNQFNESYRRAQTSKKNGTDAWSQDKYLERINAKPRPARHAAPKDGGCADKTVALLALLGGLGWVASEVVSRVA